MKKKRYWLSQFDEFEDDKKQLNIFFFLLYISPYARRSSQAEDEEKTSLPSANTLGVYQLVQTREWQIESSNGNLRIEWNL